MTRIGLIADIHANARALEAVLRRFEDEEVAVIWCAGDLVGYNAAPRETLAMVAECGMACVHGNHDLMVTGRLTLDRCGPRARRAAQWTRGILTPAELERLAALPAAMRPRDDVLCVHAALGDVERRVTRPDDFREQAQVVHRAAPAVRVCIAGHTHVPHATHVACDGHVATAPRATVRLNGHGLWFINPGSVGEPRDNDPRASCAVLDLAAWQVTFHRLLCS
jgi:predicted phosphodiesterase